MVLWVAMPPTGNSYRSGWSPGALADSAPMADRSSPGSPNTGNGSKKIKRSCKTTENMHFSCSYLNLQRKLNMYMYITLQINYIVCMLLYFLIFPNNVTIIILVKK